MEIYSSNYNEIKISDSHFRFLLLLEIDLGSKIRQFHSVDRHWKHVKNFMFYNTRNKQFHDQFFTYEHTKPHFFQSFSFFCSCSFIFYVAFLAGIPEVFSSFFIRRTHLPTGIDSTFSKKKQLLSMSEN